MSINLMNVLYTTVMIVLAFVTALVVTKTISKYTKKDNDENEL